MGITIKSLNKSIDLGYIGFDKLRTKIAGLTNKEIEELYKLYNERFHKYKNSCDIEILNEGFIRDVINSIKRSLKGKIK